jgi:hypothetical protein
MLKNHGLLSGSEVGERTFGPKEVLAHWAKWNVQEGSVLSLYTYSARFFTVWLQFQTWHSSSV